MILYHPEKKVT